MKTEVKKCVSDPPRRGRQKWMGTPTVRHRRPDSGRPAAKDRAITSLLPRCAQVRQRTPNTGRGGGNPAHGDLSVARSASVRTDPASVRPAPGPPGRTRPMSVGHRLHPPLCWSAGRVTQFRPMAHRMSLGGPRGEGSPPIKRSIMREGAPWPGHTAPSPEWSATP